MCGSRTIQQLRKQQLQLPKEPTDFNFNIPDEMTKTTDGNLFLKYDSVRYSNVLQSVYVLLTDKKEKTYGRMFQALKSITIGLCPKTIMVDFEKAAMNAINYEFPETEVKGCFFHFSQCIWRQIQDAGLQTRYKDDVTFALQVRKLPRCIDRRQKRRAPKFDISIWNCYSLVSEDLLRTNNAVEGWQNCFTSILNQCHPSIWKFILALKKEEDLNKVKFEQYIAGFVHPQKKNTLTKHSNG
ncbi:MULE domain-containing protein [Aphis craccivora]|uniref:MULE domain-containing protein n=1 Tax=Aphis craccivora TaxID=307492 RepID=A0A6G0W6A8_APHCR|nr:MULE domain-containing protein [Aphis craccivora]